MDYKDYYKVLGVEKNATDKEIKQAFRRLARQYHPDVNPDKKHAEERFKEVNEAYEVLSDPEKRRKYDQLGADWQRWQHMGGRPTDFDWSRWTTGQPGGPGVRYGTAEDLQDLFGEGSPFSDFFSQIFGSMGGDARMGGFQRQTRPVRGRDLEQPVEITLQEAYHGTVRILERDGQRFEVKIPAGSRTGTRVRIGGSGGSGVAGGPAGDLYLVVTVLSDPGFERKGDDLHTTVAVDLYTMLLGGEVRLQTMAGEVVLKIPPETQNGRSFRLQGKGMPKLRESGQYGDLFVRVEVRLPTHLTARQRELLEELHRS